MLTSSTLEYSVPGTKNTQVYLAAAAAHCASVRPDHPPEEARPHPPTMIRACGLAALVSLAAAAHGDGGASCADPFDCSLNGACKAGACVCDSPWGGAACQTLQYTVTPTSGKNLWTGAGTSENLNTWNGPIIQGADDKYHLFDPVSSCFVLWASPQDRRMLPSPDPAAAGVPARQPLARRILRARHGLEDRRTLRLVQPQHLVHRHQPVPDPTTGKLVYSLWIGGEIWVADDAAGPYAPKYKNPMSGNTAPAYANGTIYVTSQSTTEVKMAKSLAGPWSTFSKITHPKMAYTVEDPFMYIDPKGNFHIMSVSHHFYAF